MSTRDPTDLRSQTDEVEAEEARLNREQRQEQEDLKWLLAHRAGRRIAWRLMSEAGVFRSTFHTSGSVMAFNEGTRSQGIKLLTQIMATNPDAFTLMQKEAKANE